MAHDQSPTTQLSLRERELVSTLRYAWSELNTIRARDGVAYHRNDGMPYTTKEWWDRLTDMCEAAIEAATGEPPKPWPFKWEKTNDDQSPTTAPEGFEMCQNCRCKFTWGRVERTTFYTRHYGRCGCTALIEVTRVFKQQSTDASQAEWYEQLRQEYELTKGKL